MHKNTQKCIGAIKVLKRPNINGWINSKFYSYLMHFKKHFIWENNFFHCLFLMWLNSTVCFLWMYFGLIVFRRCTMFYECFQDGTFQLSILNLGKKKTPNNRDGIEEVETHTCIICLWSFSSFTQEAIKNKINSTNSPSLFLSIYFSSHKLKLSFLPPLKFCLCTVRKYSV